MTNESQLDAVTEAVAAQHSKLTGFPQPVAECWYIVEAQHLDGYGQERFLAKVFVGIFLPSYYRGLIVIICRRNQPAKL